MGQQEGRWEMVRDRGRDLEAERQPKGETASERSQVTQERQWGDKIREKKPQEAEHGASSILLFIWQILA